MAKVCPHIQTTVSLCCYMTSKREKFTIWMKSLLYHSNGCTVYNSKGEIVYRVDNYDKKGSNEVHLMDLQGKILFTIRRKRLRVFGYWDGYRWSGDSINKEKPWFQVKKYCRILTGDVACRITVGYDIYWIVRLAAKAAFRIVDIRGDVVAEAKRKQTSSGIVLGEDVLSLEVVAHMDHSLIMAFVVVYGLIRRRL